MTPSSSLFDRFPLDSSTLTGTSDLFSIGGAQAWVSGTSDAVGQCDLERENRQGTIFRKHLERTRMVACNSFFDTGKTFVSQSSGTRTRIDFITVMRNTFDAGRIGRTVTLEDVATENVSVPSKHMHDHLPVAVRLFILLEFLVCPNIAHIDRDALAIDARFGGK